MTILIARCISCRNAAIYVVVCHCHAVSQQASTADGHQMFLSHFSLSCPLIKTSMRRNWTTTIVFDELVVEGCAVTLIPSNSNYTTSATVLAALKLCHFAIGCRTRIAT